MIEQIEIPKNTLITFINSNGEKLISKDFIDLLPEEFQEDLLEIRKLASKILGKSETYLDDFDLGYGNILAKTKNDAILEIGEDETEK